MARIDRADAAVSPRNLICVRCCMRWARWCFRREQLSSRLLGGRWSIPPLPSQREIPSSSKRILPTQAPVNLWASWCGERSGMRFAGRSLLSPDGFRHRGGRGTGQTSAGESRGFHGIAQGRKGDHGCGGRPSRTHTRLCRDGQHQSGFHFAGRAAGKWREHFSRNVQVFYPGSRPVLYEAWNRVPARRTTTLQPSSTTEEVGPRVGPIQHADARGYGPPINPPRRAAKQKPG